MKKRWKIKSKLKTDEIVKVLFKNRGLKTKKQIEEFFNPPHPSLLIPESLGIKKSELKKAIIRIKRAIEKKEAIVVYGDYDADGICATAIVWEILYSLGAKVLPFIPHREEHGYGLSKKGIDEILKSQKSKVKSQKLLIITVDNGIVAHKAVEYAKEKGIDVIVTDHHQKKLKVKSQKSKVKYNLPKALKTPPRWRNSPKAKGHLGGEEGEYALPEAKAIIWSDELSGAGVAWILAKELEEKIIKRSDLIPLQGRTLYKENLDLVAIGTVADLMPVLGPNRAFVKFGLEQLNKTTRVGLNALIQEAGLKKGEIDTWGVGFMIAPRLNAMGRLEDALDSLRLLCTRDQKRAKDLAVFLGLTNRERQELTLSTFEHAREFIEKVRPYPAARSDLKQKKIIFIAHESYNQGIIGLVASKLVEQFYRPSVVVSKGKVYSKASVRSVNGFNIIQCLRQYEDSFEDVGGHPMAAGFTVKTEKLPILQQKLEELAEKQLSEELLIPTINVDCQIDLKDITGQLFAKLAKFAPFGVGNPQPTFVTRGAEVISFRQVGRDGKHLKLRLVQGPTLQRDKVGPLTTFDAIAFGKGGLALKLVPGQKIDICYTVEEDNWNDDKKLQLKIKDIKS